MKENNTIDNILVNTWRIEKMNIFHSVINYKSFGKQCAKNDIEHVRLHFGLQGSYDFNFPQLSSSYSLLGAHNNIIYTDLKEFEIYNKSKKIETFGINFRKDAFIEIAQNGMKF